VSAAKAAQRNIDNRTAAGHTSDVEREVVTLAELVSAASAGAEVGCCLRGECQPH